MTERESFLHAIRLDPFADLPRLVFADWLEEHDEPGYARFIRGHCQLDTRDGMFALRPKEVIENDGERVADCDTIANVTLTFARGFAFRVEAQSGVLIAYCKWLFANHPITDVVLTGRYPCQWQAVPRSKWARWNGYWCWNDGDSRYSGIPPSAVLPSPLNNLGDVGYRDEKLEGMVFFTSQPIANSRVSQHCVNYGRRCASLPPLEFA